MGRYIRKSPKQKRYVYTGRGILARLKEQILNIKKMENKINIAELLKDCPRGMELYSPLCGTCVFDGLNMGTIICTKQNTQEITFTSEGYYMLPVFDNCECMIFPSKDQRDWSKFQRPFKDGEILATDLGSVFYLNTRLNTGEFFGCYVGIRGDGSFHICETVFAYKECCGFATEEEKQKLFEAIKANGYKWNAETKTLEKLIVPNFKVGDRVKVKQSTIRGEILDVCRDKYVVKIYGKGLSVYFCEQDDWELDPNKFDIASLKPFENKVLCRNHCDETWEGDVFIRYADDCSDHQYYCIGALYDKCIPYEGNEHLLGKTDDCDEFYKTWK